MPLPRVPPLAGGCSLPRPQSKPSSRNTLVHTSDPVRIYCSRSTGASYQVEMGNAGKREPCRRGKGRFGRKGPRGTLSGAEESPRATSGGPCGSSRTPVPIPARADSPLGWVMPIGLACTGPLVLANPSGAGGAEQHPPAHTALRSFFKARLAPSASAQCLTVPQAWLSFLAICSHGGNEVIPGAADGSQPRCDQMAPCWGQGYSDWKQLDATNSLRCPRFCGSAPLTMRSSSLVLERVTM